MFGLRQVFMPESGFPQLLPPLQSIIYWRDTAKTQIIWTKSTGTSFPQLTLMVTLTHLSKTECGERQDHLKEDALVLTPTETGTSTGEVRNIFCSIFEKSGRNNLKRNRTFWGVPLLYTILVSFSLKGSNLSKFSQSHLWVLF